MRVILFFVAFQIRRRLCAPAISSDTCVPEKIFACGAQKLLLPLFGTDYLKVTLRHAAFKVSGLDTFTCKSCSVRQPRSRFGCSCSHGHLRVHESDEDEDEDVGWAGIHHRDRVGYTARCIAEELGFRKCVRVLEAHGAINADPERYTSGACACACACVSVTCMCLAFGERARKRERE